MADETKAVAGDTLMQSATLEALTEAANYREWLASLAIPWLGDDPLEIGSGLGDYAATWASHGISLVASEGDRSRLALLRQRFQDDPLVSVRYVHVPITEQAEHSAVVAYNVLEHVPDDVAVVRSLGGLVREGGYVVLFVPAFEVGMSPFDREIGHFRRYRREQMAAVLRRAGLQVVEARYVNPVGLMAWVIGMRLLHRRPGPGMSLRAYDRLVPILRRLEARRRPPFGQSVFAVGRLPVSTESAGINTDCVAQPESFR